MKVEQPPLLRDKTEALTLYVPPNYRPLAPISPIGIPRLRQNGSIRKVRKSASDLRLRIQLILARNGGIKKIALIPDRFEGMPGEVEINGTQGKLILTEWPGDSYEAIDLELSSAGNSFQNGIVWQTNTKTRHYRWILSKREIHVLGPSDFCGYVSIPRLLLNERQTILSMKHLREEVIACLDAAGCSNAVIEDDNSHGVPSGWLLFRDIVPIRFVPMRAEAHILNALCPLPDIEPYFKGGIQLERKTWLMGFPPRIFFTGDLSAGLQVIIDGKIAQKATDGTFEAPGWDSLGDHQLLVGGQSWNYMLSSMDEKWEHWRAFELQNEIAICGASIFPIGHSFNYQTIVPVKNSLLIGPSPGDIVQCKVRHDIRLEIISAQTPFVPIWALPHDPAHSEKKSARILLLNRIEPAFDFKLSDFIHSTKHLITKWVSAIHDAGCKGISVCPDDEEVKKLWHKYCKLAKTLRRKMR